MLFTDSSSIRDVLLFPRMQPERGGSLENHDRQCYRLLVFRLCGEISVARLFIEDVAEATVAKLKDRASHHGRSLQQELKLILEEAARQNSAESWEAIHQFRRRLQESGRVFSDSTDLLREDRER